MIKLGVAKLPDIRRDNTDRNRTSPFAFTGQKFEFRAVGSSASIAFPVTLLKVVRQVFKDTAPIRFEGNNYSEDWVKEAKKRGLPNLRRTPEALKEMISKQSRTVLTELGLLSKEELESRYHVRVERYVKDILIELHTLREMVDTMIIPASFEYL